MSIKCGFCKGTKVEPGQTDCVWCDNTGVEGGLSDKPITKGDTDPVGDCDKFEAGINVGDWFQRIVVYGDNPADAEALRDKLIALLSGGAELRKALHVATEVGTSFGDTLGRVAAERDALQQRLTVADERADVLETEVARLNRVKLALKELVESHAGNLSVYRYYLSETLAKAEKVRDASPGMRRKCLADLIDNLHQYGAALKPAECCTVSPEDQALLDAGDYTPEELFGIGGKPSCPKCFKP